MAGARTGRRARGIARALHAWLGLWLGGLFALAGLSGSLLVFYPALDAGLNPLPAAAAGGTVSWDSVLQTLHHAYPTLDGPWRLQLDTAPGPVVARYYDTPQARELGFAPLLVWVDPAAGRVLREAVWGEYVMTWIYDLHYRLLLGPPGAVVMGIAGLLLVALLVAGLVTWWPRRGTWWRSLRFKPRAAPVRRLHDLHKLAALASLLLLLLLTVTGVMLELPDQARALLAIWSPPHVMPDPAGHADTGAGAGAGAGAGGMITADAALAVVQRDFPEASPAWLETPHGTHGVYRVRFHLPGEPSTRFPHSYAWIDPHDGTVLAAIDAREHAAGDTVMNWLHPLHSGEAFGLTGRLLVLISGAFPLFLFITGFKHLQHRTPPP